MPPNSVKNKQYQNKMENIKSMSNNPKRIKNMLGEVATSLPEFDLIILCSDGVAVGCHQAVLAMASTFWRALLQSRQARTVTGECSPVSERETVILEDSCSEDIISVLNVLYSGVTKWNNDLDQASKGAKGLRKGLKLLFIDIADIRKDFKLQREATDVFYKTIDFLNEKTLDETSDDKTQITLKQTLLEKEELESVVQDKRLTRANSYDSTLSLKRKPVDDILDGPVKRTKNSEAHLAYTVEQVHTCLICKGKKDGKRDQEACNLSFKAENQNRLKEHYSKHFYEEGKFRELNPPVYDDDKMDEAGTAHKFICTFTGCWKNKKQNKKQREMGYKEFTLHTATFHGWFEEIVAVDERKEVRNLLDKLKSQSEKENALQKQ